MAGRANSASFSLVTGVKRPICSMVAVQMGTP